MLQQLKKKCQRLAAELQDTKLHLEGQQGRNHDLEKKQRRWGPRTGGAGTQRGWHPRLLQSGITILAGIWALHQLPLGRGVSSGIELPESGVDYDRDDSDAILGGSEPSDPPVWGRALWWRLLMLHGCAQRSLSSRPLSQPWSLLTLLSSRDAFISLW